MKVLLKEKAAQRTQASARIRDRIIAHSAWGKARTVALFAALPSEPDLVPLLALGEKTFVFPVVQGVELLWRQVDSEQQLQPGPPPLCLREPMEGAVVGFEHIDLVLVPGLAFTRDGARLGRGGGFYDRVLARRREALGGEERHPFALGVCFGFQVVGSLPTEPHDQTVQSLVHD
jgi:5-formyltetrahydrofolate cyclo-ligase